MEGMRRVGSIYFFRSYRINVGNDVLGHTMNKTKSIRIRILRAVENFANDRAFKITVKLGPAHTRLAARGVTIGFLYLQLIDELLAVRVKLPVCALPVVSPVRWIGNRLAHVLDIRRGVGVLAAEDDRRLVIIAENATASRVNQMCVSPSRRHIIRQRLSFPVSELAKLSLNLWPVRHTGNNPPSPAAISVLREPNSANIPVRLRDSVEKHRSPI